MKKIYLMHAFLIYVHFFVDFLDASQCKNLSQKQQSIWFEHDAGTRRRVQEWVDSQVALNRIRVLESHVTKNIGAVIKKVNDVEKT